MRCHPLWQPRRWADRDHLVDLEVAEDNVPFVANEGQSVILIVSRGTKEPEVQEEIPRANPLVIEMSGLGHVVSRYGPPAPAAAHDLPIEVWVRVAGGSNRVRVAQLVDEVQVGAVPVEDQVLIAGHFTLSVYRERHQPSIRQYGAPPKAIAGKTGRRVDSLAAQDDLHVQSPRQSGRAGASPPALQSGSPTASSAPPNARSNRLKAGISPSRIPFRPSQLSSFAYHRSRRRSARWIPVRGPSQYA